MLEGIILSPIYYYSARFLVSRIKIKVHTLILILIIILVWFLSVLLFSYYMYTLNPNITGTVMSSMVGGPCALVSACFYWGFRNGQKTLPRKKDTIKPVLDIFDEAKKSIDSMFFDSFVEDSKRRIKEEKVEILKSIVESGKTPKVWVYRMLAIELGKILQNGELHVYRGVLNPNGTALLKAFDLILDKLVEMQDMTIELAIDQKALMRKEIRSIG